MISFPAHGDGTVVTNFICIESLFSLIFPSCARPLPLLVLVEALHCSALVLSVQQPPLDRLLSRPLLGTIYFKFQISKYYDLNKNED